MQVFKRSNRLFTIDGTKLKKNTTDIRNALYLAVYQEFLGATDNPKYKDLNTLERFNKLNDFATTWLTERGLLNG
jgi:hypothetical protein